MKQGFTLLECLVVLLLTALLFSLAVPAYRHLFAQQTATKQVNGLVAALNFARSEAIMRHTTVTLCSSNDPHHCDGSWQEGWLVFIDKNAAGQITTDATILRVYAALPVGDTLAWQTTAKKSGYLQFNANGDTRGQAGSFIYCPRDPDPQNAYKITVSLTGRIRIAKLSVNENNAFCISK